MDDDGDDDDELELKKRLLNIMITDPERFGETVMTELETEELSPEIWCIK